MVTVGSGKRHHGVAVLVLALLVQLAGGYRCASGQDAVQADTTDELCELKIEGKFIEQLVLRKEHARPETFEHPGETLALPAGIYQLQQVRLTGGYICNATMRYIDPIRVGADARAVVTVGGPLKATVTVEREGRILKLSYELTGVGGEMYRPPRTGSTPGFVVHKGDKEIACGSFEYGRGGTL